jgi:hypothetical protein
MVWLDDRGYLMELMSGRSKVATYGGAAGGSGSGSGSGYPLRLQEAWTEESAFDGARRGIFEMQSCIGTRR